MEPPIQHYKENGAEEQAQPVGTRPEWEPCLPRSHPTDPEAVERPPPPPPPSKKRFRYPHRTNQVPEDKPQKNRENLLDRQVQKAAGLLGVTSSRGLLVFLILLLIIIFLFIIVIILAALWPRTKQEEPPLICSSPSCLRAAAQVIGNMENNTLPCHDFWNYACHNWFNSNPMPPWSSKWNAQIQITYKVNDQLRKLIETMPYPTRGDSVAWKLKYFYQSCTALEHFVNPEKILVRNIDQMGGWNVLRSFSVYSWNFRMVLRRLHAEFGVHAFFRVGVVAHPHFTNRSIVRISPDGLGLPDRNYYYREPDHTTINTYKVFLKDTAQILGATSSEATKFAEEVFHFEKRIAELTPNTEDIIDPLKTVQILTVADLQKQSLSVPWLEIIRAVYPSAVFDDSTELLITSTDYLRDVSSIVSSTDRSTMNNYLMWRLAHKYLPYLSSDFWAVLDIHKKDMLGAKEPLERWEMCIETTKKYFNLALGALYSRSNTVAMKEVRNSITLLHEALRDELIDSIRTSTWYNSMIRKRAIEKLMNLQLQIGYPENVLSASFLDDFYAAMTVQVNDFLGNIFDGVHFLRKMEEKMLLNPIPEHRWLTALSQDSVSYVPEVNTIVIPEHVLQAPFYEMDYPQPIILGTLGVQLSTSLVESIFQHGILYDSQGNLIDQTSPIRNESLSLTWSQRKCVTDALIDRQVDDEDFIKRTIYQTLVQLAAVQQAFKVVDNLSMEERRTEYKALEFLSHHQLFFLAYAQSACTNVTSKHRDMERSTRFVLGEEELLRSVLLQLPEFTNAFQCSTSTPLHYDKRNCGRII